MAKTLLWLLVIVNGFINPILVYFVDGSYTPTKYTVIMLCSIIAVIAICEAIESVGRKVKR